MTGKKQEKKKFSLEELQMPTPKLKLDGKTFTAPKPKAGIWRRIVQYNKSYGKLPLEDFNANEEAFDAVVQLIVDCYTNLGKTNNELTFEILEQELDLEELLPELQLITGWAAFKLQSYALKIPEKNAEAEGKI